MKGRDVTEEQMGASLPKVKITIYPERPHSPAWVFIEIVGDSLSTEAAIAERQVFLQLGEKVGRVAATPRHITVPASKKGQQQSFLAAVLELANQRFEVESQETAD